MDAYINNLPPFLQNEIVFFTVIVVGLAAIALLARWLLREIIGGGDAPKGDAQAGDASASAIYRGSAGATRTMDSSPSGILGSGTLGSMGALSRTASPQPASTSIISGSSLVNTGLTTSRDREQIEPELRMAGFYRPSALAEYKSVRAMLILLPLMAAAGLALLMEPEQMPNIIVGGIVLAALGYSIPRVYINAKARARKREIERGLPVAVDMIALGLVAGQNVMNSFQRTSHEVRRVYPILAEEMELTYRQAELNTLGHALRVWAERSGVNEVYNLSVILTQSERQGADISNSLLEFSTNYRITQRQKAEGQANRASFWMLFPTLLCMWIPAAVILAAPVYFDFAEKRKETREKMLPPGANPGDGLDKRFQPYLKGNNTTPQ